MKAGELLEMVQKFQTDLLEHQKLWGKSLDRTIPDFPIRNIETLKKQSRSLSRTLGQLRPHMEGLRDSWTMHHPATGTSWNALEAATGLSAIAQAKGPSLENVIEALDQIIGKLQSFGPDDEISMDTDTSAMVKSKLKTSVRHATHSESPAEPNWEIIHPRVKEVAKTRFETRHYADAVEAALKEVNSAVRDRHHQRTGKELDGAELMYSAFSPKNPVIRLADLSTESGRNIQQGYMQIFAGAMTGIRNPKAHENIQLTPDRAIHLLFLASLLMSKLDEAHQYNTN